MSLLTCASSASVFYGCQLAEQKRVSNVKQIEPNVYSGRVLGTSNVPYDVMINIPHARALSKCNCPHTSGRRIVCKHMVALFFTVFPDEIKKYNKKCKEAEKQAEAEHIQTGKDVQKLIKTMPRKDLELAMRFLLIHGPDWLYDKFVRYFIDFPELKRQLPRGL